MLKDIVYQGTYRGKDLTIGIILENPIIHGLSPDKLAFSVSLKSNADETLWFEDFTFHIVDESECRHST